MRKEFLEPREMLERSPAVRRIVEQFENAGETNETIETLLRQLAWTFEQARQPERYYTKKVLKDRSRLAARLRSFAKELENDRDMQYTTQVWLKPPEWSRTVWSNAPFDPPPGQTLAALMSQAADYMMEDYPKKADKVKQVVILEITRHLSPGDTHQVRLRHLNKEVAALASLMLDSPATPEAVKKLLQRKKVKRGDKT